MSCCPRTLLADVLAIQKPVAKLLTSQLRTVTPLRFSTVTPRPFPLPMIWCPLQSRVTPSFAITTEPVKSPLNTVLVVTFKVSLGVAPASPTSTVTTPEMASTVNANLDSFLTVRTPLFSRSGSDASNDRRAGLSPANNHLGRPLGRSGARAYIGQTSMATQPVVA